jgi:hypothetical protein
MKLRKDDHGGSSCVVVGCTREAVRGMTTIEQVLTAPSIIRPNDIPLCRLIEEYRTISLLTDKPLSFPERILKYPSATTFWTSKKNRFPEILPTEDTRVHLSHTGAEGSDYINANYIFSTSDYIATQAPLPHTAADFW